ncbi:SAM-dependent methyltransferase [Priestia flexa]|uniref:N-6 DNA methylase n=1 Tax=Priestia flexa TaxID=86664 RepID=UPI00209CAD1E|nr:N-6 DNA methylase [Priestia flexa]MCP1188028.1 SAM-dependent methyltransferase [Priestia flexa]
MNIADMFKNEVSAKGGNYLDEMKVILDQLEDLSTGVNLIDVKYPDVMKELMFLSKEELLVKLELILKKISLESSHGELQDPEFVTNAITEVAKSIVKDTPISLADITSGLGFTQRKLLKELNTTETLSFELKEVLVQIQQKVAKLSGLSIEADQKNVIMEGVPESKVDIVSYTGPFGGRVDRNELTNSGDLLTDIKTTETELLILDKAFTIARPGGYIITVLPSGFLFKGGATKKVRDAILKQAYVKSIISLPSNVFLPYSGVSTCMLILQKKSKDLTEPEDVIMGDFSDIKVDKKQELHPTEIKEFTELCKLLSEREGVLNGN